MTQTKQKGRCKLAVRGVSKTQLTGQVTGFATIGEAEILKIQDAVPENTNKATKSVVEITECVYTKTIIL